MKVRPNTARTGLQWVRLGWLAYRRQPLVMTGMFFLFMFAVTLLSTLPLIGTALAVALVPAATLAMMAATRDTVRGKAPGPQLLLLAFGGDPARVRAMLMLGALYTAALLGVVLLSSLFAGGAPAPAPVPAGGEVTPEMVGLALNRPGALIAMLAYLPVMMAFWHAPALVYWGHVSPVKSLFFSLLACWGNRGAMLLFLLGWGGIFIGLGLLLGLLSSLLGGLGVLQMVAYPLVIILATAFHASLWFTVDDSFQSDPPAGTQPGQTPG